MRKVLFFYSIHSYNQTVGTQGTTRKFGIPLTFMLIKESFSLFEAELKGKKKIQGLVVSDDAQQSQLFKVTDKNLP